MSLKRFPDRKAHPSNSVYQGIIIIRHLLLDSWARACWHIQKTALPLELTAFCFFLAGLYDNYPTNAEPECCDVRWGLLSDNQSKGTIKTSDSMMCHRTSLTVSSASRLCNSRLKLCVLVLILLHTVLTVSAAQNSTELGFGGITNLEDNATNEE